MQYSGPAEAAAPRGILSGDSEVVAEVAAGEAAEVEATVMEPEAAGEAMRILGFGQGGGESLFRNISWLGIS